MASWFELGVVALVAAIAMVVRWWRRQDEARRMPSLAQDPVQASSEAANPDAILRIRDYFEQYRHTYHRDAPHRKLIADGHDPQAVYQAMVQVYGAESKRLWDVKEEGRPFWIALVVTLLANGLLVPALLAFVSRGEQQYGVLNAMFVPLAVVPEFILASLLRGRSDAARGVYLGSVLYFALIPVWFGTCFLVFRTFGLL